MDLDLDDQGYLEDAEDGGHLVFHGKGKKGKIYGLGDFWFVKDKHNDRVGKTYFRCREYRARRCPVRAFKEVGGHLNYSPGFGPGDHTCDPNPLFGEYLERRKDLIELMLQQPRNGPTRRQIFLDFVQNINDPRIRQQFSLYQIEAAVEYRRARAKPNLHCPRNFTEVDDLLQNPDSAYLGRTKDDKEQFYRGMVGEPGEENLIFASDRMLSVPKRQKDVIGSDSTFKITPRLLGASQVLILSFFAFGKCFPMAYVVMKAKTTNSYATALGALREMGMPANIVVLDWEVAERNAWRRVYPGVKLWGCLWHFIRCLFRKVRQVGLQSHWKCHSEEGSKASLIIRLCCALPRLPDDRIQEGYAWVRTLLEDVGPEDLKIKTYKFLEYIGKEWISKTDLRQLSVYTRSVTSSSGQEGVHRSLNAQGDRHPLFPEFLELAQNSEDQAFKSYQQTMATGQTVGRTWASKISKKRLQIDEDISEAKKTYAHTKSVKDFLIMCQPSIKKDFLALQATPDDDPINPIQLGNQDIQSEGEGDDPEEFVEPHGDPINPIQLGESSESQVDDPMELNTWSAMGESTWDEGPSTSGHGADMSDPGGGSSPGSGFVPDGPSCSGPSEKRKARYQRLKRQRLRKEGKEVLSEAKKMKKRERAKAMKKLKRQKEREASQNYSRMKLRKTPARRAQQVAAMKKGVAGKSN